MKRIAFICILAAFAIGVPSRSRDLPSVKFTVQNVDGKVVSVEPLLPVSFKMAGEIHNVLKGDVLSCVPRGINVNQRGTTPIVLTELDCNKQGQLFIEEVDFSQ